LGFLFATRAKADPLCWPYSATATRVYSSVNLKGFAVAWFCDISHQWRRTGFAGHWSDLKPNWTTQPAAQPFAPQATMKAAWDANITNTLEDPASPDHDMFDLYLSTGAPESYPPSGLVTQDTKVYKQRVGVGTATWVQIGTVALGVPCDQTLRVEPYFSIPRSSVKLASKFDTYATELISRNANEDHHGSARQKFHCSKRFSNTSSRS
jgi:hypothetical protein